MRVVNHREPMAAQSLQRVPIVLEVPGRIAVAGQEVALWRDAVVRDVLHEVHDRSEHLRRRAGVFALNGKPLHRGRAALERAPITGTPTDDRPHEVAFGLPLVPGLRGHDSRHLLAQRRTHVSRQVGEQEVVDQRQLVPETPVRLALGLEQPPGDHIRRLLQIGRVFRDQMHDRRVERVVNELTRVARLPALELLEVAETGMIDLPLRGRNRGLAPGHAPLRPNRGELLGSEKHSRVGAGRQGDDRRLSRSCQTGRCTVGE